MRRSRNSLPRDAISATKAAKSRDRHRTGFYRTRLSLLAFQRFSVFCDANVIPALIKAEINVCIGSRRARRARHLFHSGIITSDARSRAFLQVRASYLRLSLSDDRALWCKCNPDTDMGISRVASEIQIYSAVYSPVVDRDVCVGVSRARRHAHTYTHTYTWLVMHPAGRRACANSCPQLAEITFVP